MNLIYKMQNLFLNKKENSLIGINGDYLIEYLLLRRINDHKFDFYSHPDIVKILHIVNVKMLGHKSSNDIIKAINFSNKYNQSKGMGKII